MNMAFKKQRMGRKKVSSLFPKHGLEGAVNLLTGMLGHTFEYIFS